MEERKAIAPHKTATTDGAWDGPEAKARLKLDQDASYYRKAFAWQDPEGDPTKKGSYKFIHHEVSSAGDIGAANLEACSAGIAILNGGRGGTKIPDADRQGVYDHLAKHIRDAGNEPPELRSLGDAFDYDGIRYTHGLELRDLVVDDTKKKPVISGYASVFNSLSDDLGGFRERVKPGAFNRDMTPDSDVRALRDHEPSMILGRTKAGTLRLSTNNKGLLAEIDPPDTTVGRDTVESIKRGDLDGMSFSFRAMRDGWKVEDGQNIRELHDVKLGDVSVVTYPAYPATSVGMRSLFREQGLQEESIAELCAAAVRLERSLELQERDMRLIAEYRSALSTVLPKAAIHRLEEAASAIKRGRSVETVRRQLSLLDI